jgi:hypothetical protein
MYYHQSNFSLSYLFGNDDVLSRMNGEKVGEIDSPFVSAEPM